MPIPFTRTFNNSLTFSGSTGQYLNFGNNLSKEKTDAFSYSGWVKQTARFGSGGGSSCSLLNKIIAANSGYGFEFSAATAGLGFLEMWLQDTTGVLQVKGQFNSFLNVWYFVTITYNGSATAAGMNFYINGELLTNKITQTNTYAGGSLLNSTDALMFRGTYVPLSSGQFIGSITEPRLHNTELTAQEVSDLYYGNNPTHVQDYWPLTEGSGTTMADTVGGITGTLVGSPTWSTVVVPSIQVRNAVSTPRNPVV